MTGFHRRTSRSGIAARAALAFAIACVLTLAVSTVALARVEAIVRISSGGDLGSYRPSVSADARYVAFESDAHGLVATEAPDVTQVYVFDRTSKTMERVSVADDGTPADSYSYGAALSGDGRWVAFCSESTNLTPSTGDITANYYLYDRQTDTIKCLTASATDCLDMGERPTISADGRYVAYGTSANNIVPGDTNNASDIFVYDQLTDETERISVNDAHDQGDGNSSRPSISANGNLVVFESYATNLVASDTNAAYDVFLFDRTAHSISRVSVNASGGQASGNSQHAFVSADGAFVAYDSDAADLVTSDTNGVTDVFRYRVSDGSVTNITIGGNAPSSDGQNPPTMNGDGSFVAFSSVASNLVPDDTNETTDVSGADIFVYDVAEDAFTRESVTTTGSQSDGPSYAPVLDAAGGYVAFHSDAANLTADDTNGASDVFMRDRYLDVVPPTTIANPSPASPDGSAGWYVTTPTITLVPNEPATVYYQWDTQLDGGWSTYGTAITPPLGSHTLYYYGIDTTENTETVKSLALKVDTELPLASTDATGFYYFTATINLAATDTVSGLDGVYWRIDGAADFTESTQAVCTVSGAHTIEYYAKDLAGNYGNAVIVPFEVANRYEQTDPNITWGSSKWRTYWGSQYSGNSFARARGLNAGFIVRFDGSAIDWLGQKSPMMGIARLSLDGGATQTVDLYSASTLDRQVLWSQHGLTNGSHTLRVDWTGTHNPSAYSDYINADAFDIAGQTSPASEWVGIALHYEENDPYVSYGTTYTSIASTAASGGSLRTMREEGNGYSVTFYGVALELTGRRGPDQGIAQILIDGTPWDTVDFYSPTVDDAQMMWNNQDFYEATHTVRVEWTGSKNASSSGDAINLDALDIVGVLDQAPEHTTRYQETDTRVYYSGAWSDGSHVSHSGGAWKYLNSAGGAYVTFVGKRFDLYASKGPAYGKARVKLDGVETTSVDLYSASTQYQQKLLSLSGLSDGSHVLALEWLNQKNGASSGYTVGLDAFDLVGRPVTDTVAPFSADNATSAWRATPATVTLTATDTNSYVAGTRYRVNAGTLTTYTAPFAVSTEGTDTIEYCSVDGAGNWESTKTATVRIDYTAPTVGNDAPGGWVNSTANVHLNATDTMSGVSSILYSTDGTTPTVSYTTSIPVSADGTTTIRYTAIDAVGNASSVASVAVRVDKVLPFSSSDAPSGWSSATVNVAISATDTLSGVASRKYVLDGGGLTTYASPVAISAEGTHTLLFYAIDVAGNREATNSATVRVDKTAPTISSDAPAGWVDAPVAVHLSATDTVSGVASVLYSLDGSEPTLSYGTSITVSTEGTTTLRYKAIDRAGVSSAGTSTVRVDLSDPTASDDAPSGWMGANVTVHLSATDTVSGIQSLLYSTDGSEPSVSYASGVTISTEGTITLRYKAVDRAGRSVLATTTVRVDKTAPSIATNVQPNYMLTADISIFATDTLSGVSLVEYRLDGSTWTTGTGLTVDALGTHYLDYRATDNVAHSGAATATFDIGARWEQSDAAIAWAGDWTTETAGAASGGNYRSTVASAGTWTGYTVSFKGTGVDLIGTYLPTGGQARVLLDGGATQTVSFYSPSTMYQQAFYTRRGLTDTTHTVRVEWTGFADVGSLGDAIDLDAVYTVGPMLEAPAHTTRFDDADSRVLYQNWQVSTNANCYTGSMHYASSNPAKATFLFRGTGFDLISMMAPPYSIATVTVDGVPASADMYNSTYVYQRRSYTLRGLAEATHTVTVERTGILGPGGYANVSIDAIDVVGTLVADVVAPVTTDDADAAWRSSPETVTLNSTDSGWGVLATRYRVNGSALATYSAPLAVTGEGTSTIEFFSIDRAGNVEATKSATVRIDRTAPSIGHDAPSGWVHGPVTVHISTEDTGCGSPVLLYSLDGGDPTVPYPSSGVTITAEGTTTLRYSATDALGNARTGSAEVRIDDSAPESTHDAPSGWVTGTVSVTLSATDTYSGLAGIRWVLDGSQVATYAAPILVSADGTHTLTRAAVDHVGNIEATKSATVRIDNSAPSVSINATASYLNTATISISTTDMLSGVALVEHRLDSGSWSAGTTLTVLTPGTHVLEARASDSMGNVATTSATFDVAGRVDDADSRVLYQNWQVSTNASCYTGSMHYASSNPAKATFLFRGTGFDLISMMAPTYSIATVTVDGVPASADMYNSTYVYQRRSYTLRGLAEATHTVTVERTGILGPGGYANVSIDAIDVVGTLVADVVAPVTTDDADAAWRSSPETVTLNSTDSGWGVLATRYRVNGSALATYSAPLAVTGEGTSTIEFFSIDRAGNVEATKSATVRIDRTAPSIGHDAPSGWVHGPVTVHISTEDTGCGSPVLLYSLDGGDPTVPYPSSGVTITAEGTTTLRYSATDALGNARTGSAEVRIDDSAPESTHDAPSGWVTGTVSVTLSATDTYSGLAGIRWVLDGSQVATYAAPILVSADGTHTLTRAAVDHVGNIEATKSATVRIDNSAPSVSINATASYLNTATISISTTDMLSGVALVEHRLDSGSWSAGTTLTVLTPGTHVLEARASDSMGNVATTSATFDVAGRVDDADSRVLYQNWQVSTNASCYTGSMHYASSNPAKATFLFRGTGFDLISMMAPPYSIATVTVDGVPASADMYNSTYVYQRRSYTLRGLAEATHTVTVERTGILGPGGYANVSIDAIDVVGTLVADVVAPVTTDDADAAWRSSPETVTLNSTDSGWGVLATRYRVNGSALATYSAPLAVTGEGTSTIEFFSIDRAGNVEATKSATVRIDRTAPSIGHDAPSGWVHGPVTVHISTEDTGCGSPVLLYSLDGGDPTVPYPSSGVTITAEGTTTLRYSATDALGNARTGSAEVRIDDSAPESTHDAPSGWVTGTVSVTLSATDTYSGLAGIRWVLDGSQVATYAAPILVSADGTHTLTRAAVDHVGNIEATKSATVRIDTSAPSVSDDAPGGWVTSAVTVHLSTTDTVSGIGSVLYSLDGSEPTVPYTGAISVTAEGTTTVRYASTDVAGNSTPGTATVRIDTSAPSVSDDAPGGWVTSAVTVHLSTTDTVSGIGSVLYSLDGSEPTVPYTGAISVTAEGTTTVRYASTDVAGNSTPGTATVRIDTSAPSVSDDAPGGWVTSAVTVHLSTTDTVSGIGSVLYSLDGSEPTVPYTGAIPVTAEGTTTVRYASTDVAGNSTPGTATVRIDNSAPSVSDDAPGGWVTGTVSVTLGATDTVSGLQSLVYSTDGSAPTLTYDSGVTITAEGTTTLRYKATDVAGNYTSIQNQVRIDNSAPSVSINATASYLNTATISISTTDMLSGVALVEHRLDSGSWSAGTTLTVLTPGTHVLEARASDSMGNVATTSATFDVAGRVDDADSRVLYQNWQVSTNASCYTGSMHYASSNPAKATFLFRGTGFDLISMMAPPYSIATVTVDGVPASADMYNSTYVYQRRSYTLRGLAEATHTVTVERTGILGPGGYANVSIDAIDVVGTLVADVVAPVTTDDADAAWRSSPETVTLNSTDSGWGVLATRYRVNGSALATYSAPLAVTGEGTSTIEFFSIDRAGNVEATKSATVRIDRTAPSIGHDAPSGWVHGPVTVHISTEDTGCGSPVLLYSLDGGDPTVPYPSSGVTITAEGTTTLRYSATDALGNARTGSAEVRIDDSAPESTHDAPSGWVTGTVSVTLSATDTYSGLAGIRWVLDGSQVATYAAPILVSADGTHTLTRAAVDHVGNIEATKSATVRIDTSAPSVSDDAPGGWVTSAVTVHLSTTDTVSGIGSVLYSLDGSEPTVPYTGAIPVTAEGTTTVRYASTDVAGNSTPGTATVRIDNSAPSVSDDAPGGWVTSAVTVHLSTTDTVSGIGSVLYSLDGSEPTVPYTGAIPVTAEGTTTVRYASTDVAGNSTPGTATVRIDNSAPSVSDDAPGGWVTSAVTVHLSTTDTVSGIGSVLYSLDGSEPTVPYTGAISVTAEGTTTVRYASTDVAGNSTPGTATVRIDTSAPSVSDDAPGGWVTSAVTVHLSTTDTVSGIGSVLYSLDGSEPTVPYTGAISVTAEGTTTVRYASTDVAGNSTPGTATVRIDTSAPSVSDDAPGGWVTSAVTVHLSTTDTVSGIGSVLYSLDGSEPTVPYTGAISVTAEGTTTVRYASTDVAGHTTGGSNTLRLDLTLPSVSTNATSSYLNTASIAITATDTPSGLAAVDHSLDGGTWTAGTTLTVLTPGTHTLIARATDIAGNTNTRTVTFDVAGRIDSTDSRILYENYQVNTNTSHYGGSIRYAGTNPAKTTFLFRGTGFDLIAYMAPQYGIATVTVDGTSAAVDMYSATYDYKRRCYTLRGLPDATHTVTIERTGRVSGGSYANVSVDALDVVGAPLSDAIAPITTSDASSAWRSTPATVTLSSTDAGWGVNAIRYRVNASAVATYTAPLVVTAEGTNTIEYFAIDKAGNVEVTRTATVRIDRVAPVVNNDASVSWTTGPVSVHLTAEETGSGTPAILYSTDGSDPAIPYSSAMGFAAEGTTTVRWSSTDAIGNSRAGSFDVRIDNTPPGSTSNAPSDWGASPLGVSIIATDPLSGPAGIRWVLDGSDPTTYGTSVVVSGEGTHTLSFAAIDHAGNVESTKSATFRLDATLPSVSTNATSSYLNTASITITATDTPSGLAGVDYRVDGGSWTAGTTLTVVTPGTHTLVARAADVAGNTNTKTVTFDVAGRIDSTDSRVYYQNFQVSNNSSYYGGSLRYASTNPAKATFLFRGTGFDIISYMAPPYSIATVTVDGVSAAVDMYSPTYDYKRRSYTRRGLADATHTVTVERTGIIGPGGYANVSIDALDIVGTPLADSAAPVTSSDAVGSYNETAAITLTATDTAPSAGILSTKWRLDGGTWNAGASVVTTQGGSHTLDWYSTDVAGNVETTKSAVFQIVKRLDQTDSRIMWEGAWQTASGAYYGGSLRYAGANPAKATFLFRGTGFDIISYTGPPYGVATVTVDGAPVAVDMYTSTYLYQRRTYTRRDLADTTHTVTIERTGIVSGGTAANVSIDAIDLVGAIIAGDVTPPNTTSNTAASYINTATITLTPTDASAIAYTRWRLDASAWTTGTSVTTTQTGAHTLYWYSADVAGNVEPTKTATFDLLKRIDESDAAVSYQGFLSSSNPSYYGGTLRYATSSPARATFVFRGTGFDVRSYMAPPYGIATVTIDGASVAVDMYSPTYDYQRRSYSKRNLADTTHTVTIDHTGQVSGGTGAYISIDAIDVLGTMATVDVTPPSTSSNAVGSYINTATITLTPTDASGIAYTKWRLDGSAWTTGTSVTTTQAGTHSLEWYSTDTAGNVESTKSASFALLRRLDDSDANITYENFLTTAGSSFYGATLHYAATNPARATFKFRGTGFDILSYTGPPYGIATVTVDGASAAADMYSASWSYQRKTYSLRGLADTTHTVVIDRTGMVSGGSAANISIDAIDILGTIVAADLTPPVTTSNAVASYVNTATVTLSPTDASGIAYTRWRLDGSEWTTGTVVSTSLNGTHTLEWYSADTEGNTETAKSATFAVLTRIDDTDGAFSYLGFSGTTNVGFYGGSAHFASSNPASATFQFRGTGFDLISYMAPPYGIATITIDGVSAAVDMYSATWDYQRRSYSRRDLTDTTHTVTIERTGAKSSGTAANVSVDAVDILGVIVRP